MEKQTEVQEQESMIGLPDEAFSIINEYNLASTAIKEAEKRKEDAKLQLISLLGTSKIGICADIKVSYTVQTRKSVDPKMLEKFYPEAFDHCSKETQFMQMRISHIK